MHLSPSPLIVLCVYHSSISQVEWALIATMALALAPFPNYNKQLIQHSSRLLLSSPRSCQDLLLTRQARVMYDPSVMRCFIFSQGAASHIRNVVSGHKHARVACLQRHRCATCAPEVVASPDLVAWVDDMDCCVAFFGSLSACLLFSTVNFSGHSFSVILINCILAVAQRLRTQHTGNHLQGFLCPATQHGLYLIRCSIRAYVFQQFRH